jgi:UDP-N-acetylmuramoyl-L-alanyl-D-glutamate--2,6-diaminopimelate ligase
MGISRTWVRLPLVGRFNVENALAALLAVLLSGASPSNALEGLATVAPAPGRLEPVPTGDRGFVVLVDYAHTPDALRKVLGGLRESTPGGRVVCVFGCGGERDAGKRGPMGETVNELADVAVVTSDNPRGEDPEAIIAQIVAGMAPARAELVVEPDRRAAIRHAIDAARPGDVVLIAGKGHETTQTVGSQSVELDDRLVAREALGGSAC